jgi:hypothetical protein
MTVVTNEHLEQLTRSAAYSYFIYDPKGNMVLSSNSVLTNTQTAPRRLVRDFSSTYSSNGEVQIIRKSNSDYNVAVQGQYTDAMQVYTATFSLADGLKANTQWQAAVLFDTVPEAATPLEAPTDSISDTLGVSPLDVAAPGDIVPSTGDEGDTAAPAEAGQGEETQPSVDGDVSAPVASEETQETSQGTTSFDVSAPLTGLADLNAPVTSQPAASQTTPDTSEVVLPETMTSVNTTDIAAPINRDTPVIPEVPASDAPGEIAALGELDSAPSLGNLPSDSSLDIGMPETLEASIPPIENTPQPLDVAPPEGFALDDETIDVYGGIDTITEQTCKNTPWLMQCGGSGKPPKTVDDKDDDDKPEGDPDVGGNSKDREPTVYETIIIADLSNQIKGGVNSNNTKDFILLTLDYVRTQNGGTLDPAQVIAALKYIRDGVSSGDVTSQLVDDTTSVLVTIKAAQNEQTPWYLGRGLSTALGTARTLKETIQWGKWFGAGLQVTAAAATAWAIQSMLLPLAGTGEMTPAARFLSGVLMASSNAKTGAATPVPATGAVAASGSPNPQDPCDPKNYGPTVGELRANGLKDAHHIIQDAAVRNLPGYGTNAAPGVVLSGPSNTIGTPHNLATQAQRGLAMGGNYGSERLVAYRALREGGLSIQESLDALERADKYFRECLGIDLDTITNYPGNRTGR